MMNRNEIPAAEAKIKAEIAERGTAECKEVETLIDTYTDRTGNWSGMERKFR